MNCFVPQVEKNLMYVSRSSVLKNEYNLTAGKDELDGYIEEGQIDNLANKFFLEPDLQGNITMHISTWLPESNNVTPQAILAADLAESSDPRARHAGKSKIEALLNEWKANHSR